MLEIIDLTKPLDESLVIYRSGNYSDPPLEIETWCTIQGQGYKVCRLSMGTQTGTHIDAPAHFHGSGATLEILSLDALIGRYLWVDLDHVKLTEVDALRSRPIDETILFLASSGQPWMEISEEIFNALLNLPCLVWIIVSGVRIAGREELYFNKALAEAGRYLIEDVDETMAMQVKAGGEMIALPLRLKGATGSPCRVVVRQEKMG